MPIKNPVTADEMKAAASQIGFTIPAGHEDDYIGLLSKTDASCEMILAQEGKSYSLSGRWVTATNDAYRCERQTTNPSLISKSILVPMFTSLPPKKTLSMPGHGGLKPGTRWTVQGKS